MNTRGMTDRLQDWQKRVGESARNAGQATNLYVRENTWKTIAIAAAVGCIFGLLLGRRQSEEYEED